MPKIRYDALLVLSFGGPDRREDVMPFLERVTRGRNIPRERLEEVAGNYYACGGKSPINDQCRALIEALRKELPGLPVYWGNRNWHPLVEDTMRQMRDDGVRRAVVFVTSAWSSYSGCRQYREDLERARAAVGDDAPVCDKLRQFCFEPGFIEPLADNVRAALARGPANLLFTAHSIPLSMAAGSRYVEQLSESCRLVAGLAGGPEYKLVYQSRSGPPGQPWLEPDLRDALTAIAAGAGPRAVVVAPIGFISDHMEVVFDLDVQAREHAGKLGLSMIRCATAGTDPRFIRMIGKLIEERSRLGEEANWCREDCCPAPARHAPS